MRTVKTNCILKICVVISKKTGGSLKNNCIDWWLISDVIASVFQILGKEANTAFPACIYSRIGERFASPDGLCTHFINMM
jgi:hypothetical protein